MKREELKPGARVRNLQPDQVVTVTYVEEMSDASVLVGYRQEDGQTSEQIVFLPDGLLSLEAVHERQLHFNTDGHRFRLIAEAWRLRNVHLFDPYAAVHSARIRPLPHQIAAVYGEMLPRPRLRFLLADDPGAGKTIMTGLYICELMARSTLRRCLICVPPGLALQWQQELSNKFSLSFEIINDYLKAARNPFSNHRLAIVSMDTLKQKEHLDRLKGSNVKWDLIVCDEAHKMAAHWSGGEITYTDRYRLGDALGDLSENLLLLTATPHNGKQDEYELFLRLLDSDRFGRRPGRADQNEETVVRGKPDYMRRMVKEDLSDFEGKPLFPERRASTLIYNLPNAERRLYEDVTAYVREEFNRADLLESGQRYSVGFALTILQRRLASSPLAIYRSLQRRREKLEALLRSRIETPSLQEEDLDQEELASGRDEHRSIGATAARNRKELQKEIESLHTLEHEANQLYRQGVDRKWKELEDLLQHHVMRQADRNRRHKLVIFTEYRDTQGYLAQRLKNLRGFSKEVCEIHGGIDHTSRQKVQKRFSRNNGPSILVATDAAAEGINLQAAHLMINYDLPWNPNRLQQRFGRIHRINQNEVCHLWNLVAGNTREGAVFKRLEEKIRAIGETMSLFDVLGEELPGLPLRKLLIDAVRYNDEPEVRDRLGKRADNYMELHQTERELILQKALARDVMDLSEIDHIRDDLLRRQGMRLQPFLVHTFLRQALQLHNVKFRSRGHGRYEIRNIPYPIRVRHAPDDQELDQDYRRLYFDMDRLEEDDEPDAELLHPAHPLVVSVSALMLKDNNQLRRGTLLVDETDSIDEPMAVFTVRLAIQNGKNDEVAGEANFIAVDRNGDAHLVSQPPWLEFRPARDAEREQAQDLLNESWLRKEDAIETAQRFATSYLARALLDQTRDLQLDRISREREQVCASLKQRIQHEEKNVNLERQNEEKELDDDRRNLAIGRRIQAEQRRDEHQQTLDDRLKDLNLQEHLSVQQPAIIAAVLVLPQHMVSDEVTAPSPSGRERQRLAIEHVLKTEHALGHTASDLSQDGHGFDIESRDTNGSLRFIRVRSYSEDANQIVLTQNELIAALNAPDRFILALVRVQDGRADFPCYIHGSKFPKKIMDEVNISVNLEDLLSQSETPDGNSET